MEVEEREVNGPKRCSYAVSGMGAKRIVSSCDRNLILAPRERRGSLKSGPSRNVNVTHVKLVIKPDKGRKDLFAKLTSLVLADVI